MMMLLVSAWDLRVKAIEAKLRIWLCFWVWVVNYSYGFLADLLYALYLT